MKQQTRWPDNKKFLQTLQEQWLEWWSQSLVALQSATGAHTKSNAQHRPIKNSQSVKIPIAAALPIQLDSEKLLQVQSQYLEEAETLCRNAYKPGYKLADNRFKSESWSENPIANSIAAVYLLHARTLGQMAETVVANKKAKERLRFITQQWVDAMSPANFLALNPEVQRRILETEGQSLAQGVQNLLHDLRTGRISQTDETVFEVGKNVATSEGAVVFENELFQLIEYKPLSDKVYERPFLFIPPCINKFYILDLQPTNSLIRYVVAQGHRTFVLSWRNPDASMAHVTWDDYIEMGAIKAIAKVCEISGSKDTNVLGFCVGGTILANALAVLAEREEKWVHSATFLTTLVDFSDTGVLDVFIDEGMVRYREKQFCKGGLLPGKDLAATFNFLRPNDLVWNYVQRNYMLGKLPVAFDLLYWNGDSTNLPGPMYAWYLRNTYLENRLVQPGACVVAGSKIDLRKIKIPLYFYASREDHIVPPQSAYAGVKHFGSKDKRFVLGASGHIAGVINPPGANKRCYWSGTLAKTKAYDDWVQNTVEHQGSWWPDWAAWLKQRSGTLVSAPKRYGNIKHKPVEAAPGRYVKAKA